MNYPISTATKVLWTAGLVLSALLYHIYDHWIAGAAIAMCLYRLFQMDMLELTVKAFQTTVENYENDVAEIEDCGSDQEEIEERAEMSERQVLNSYLFAKRIAETEDEG